MKVLPTSKHIGYPDDFRKYFDFKRFEKDCGDFVFLEGYFEADQQWGQFGFSKKYLKSLLKKRLVRLDIEEPNKFSLGDNPDTYDHYFETIFTICPYTAKWLNQRQGNHKRIPVYYPTNENYIPKKTKKIYDIIYIGFLVNKSIEKDIQTISKYNYRFVSYSKHPLVTDHSVNYNDKFKLLSQTRISLIHNLLYPKHIRIANIWRAKDWQKNEAFKFVPKWYEFWKILDDKNIIIPQAKSRLFESALSRSLILCKKDPFNIIERYFEPNKEFIYYEEEKLGETVDKILANYPKYTKVANNAFNRASKFYTTRAFARDYLSKL